MARVRIAKANGNPSKYFWKDNETGDRERMTVYKKTENGVRRQKGVHFNAVKNELVKD